MNYLKFPLLLLILCLTGCAAATTGAGQSDKLRSRRVASAESSTSASTISMDKFYVIIPAQNGDPSEICEDRPETKRLENCEPYAGQQISFPENRYKLEANEEIEVKPGSTSTPLATHGWGISADGIHEGAVCTMLHSSSNLSRKIKPGEQFTILQASPLQAAYIGSSSTEESRVAGAKTTLKVRSDSTKVSYKVECTYYTKIQNGLEALLEQINNANRKGHSKIIGTEDM